jgi:hypothetical protein
MAGAGIDGMGQGGQAPERGKIGFGFLFPVPLPASFACFLFPVRALPSTNSSMSSIVLSTDQSSPSGLHLMPPGGPFLRSNRASTRQESPQYTFVHRRKAMIFPHLAQVSGT